MRNFLLNSTIVHQGTGWKVRRYGVELLESRHVLNADGLATLMAVAGGPYQINEGESLTLDGSGSSAPAGAVFQWDINGDGVFGDATGMNPTVPYDRLNDLRVADGPRTINSIRLSITDGVSTDISDPTRLRVINTAPSVVISGPSVMLRGLTTEIFTFTATDPNPFDEEELTIFIDWTGDFQVDQTLTSRFGLPTSTSRAFETDGWKSIVVGVADNDGGFSISVHYVEVIPWRLEPNGKDPSLMNLVFGGTPADDFILVLPGSAFNPAATADVVGLLNFAEPTTAYFVGGVTGDIVVRGAGGNDWIIADLTLEGYPSLYQDLQLSGETGDDLLVGGIGSDTIFGGSGDDILMGGRSYLDAGDTLNGGTGNDVIYGGAGSDFINGAGNDDLMIAGLLNLSGPSWPGFGIREEWAKPPRNTDEQKLAIFAHLTGAVPGGLNGEEYLIAGFTVLDDESIDYVYGEGSGLDWYWVDSGEDLTPDIRIWDVRTEI